VWQTCFVRANEQRGVGFYVGLIAAHNRQGFPRMQLAAYVLSYGQGGRVVCEPATLDNRKDDSCASEEDPERSQQTERPLLQPAELFATGRGDDPAPERGDDARFGGAATAARQGGA
jgi:hypothetical protein